MIDDHCHGILRNQQDFDLQSWRQLFTESRDSLTPQQHVPNTLFYRRLIRDVSEFLRCAPDAQAVLAARNSRDTAVLIKQFLDDAKVDAFLFDVGLPPPEETLAARELQALCQVRIYSMLRLETLMQTFVREHSTWPVLSEAFRDEIRKARQNGYVALKSIAAYRTGLRVEQWDLDVVKASLADARGEVSRSGNVRLGYKPVLDSLLHIALSEAALLELPVQFHVGYGDTDADLLQANPLLLRAIFENPDYRAVPIVLLHGCYPYTREGAYLASVYGNVYLDLSYAIPFLSQDEMIDMTRAAFAVAPLSKLLYSSDASRIPELHWMGARAGRRVLSAVLESLVESNDLPRREAEDVGMAILRENARNVYKLQL